MFARSWAAAVQSLGGHRALAGPVWNRIKAKVADPLFLVWSRDARTRAVYEERLTKSVRATIAAASEPPRAAVVKRAKGLTGGARSLEMATPSASAARAEAVGTFQRLQVPMAVIERMAATKASKPGIEPKKRS